MKSPCRHPWLIAAPLLVTSLALVTASPPSACAATPRWAQVGPPFLRNKPAVRDPVRDRTLVFTSGAIWAAPDDSIPIWEQVWYGTPPWGSKAPHYVYDPIMDRVWAFFPALDYPYPPSPGGLWYADPGATPAVGTGTVRVQLTDDPASYDAVNLQVVEVAVHRGIDDSEAAAEDSDPNGWEVLSDQAATYDLLTLRNCVFTTMAIGQVPARQYTQVRLKLGSGSNVVADGVSHDLKVPSGIQSGYKLIGGFDVPAGGSVDIAIDFDASRSIVHTGADTCILKPTARVVVAPAATTGSIQGVVDPTDVAVAAFAISGPDTVGASATVPGDGSFVLPMLAPGSYDVALHPSAIYFGRGA